MSESVKGTGRAARNRAKETEGRLLGEVAAGKHRATGAMSTTLRPGTRYELRWSACASTVHHLG